MSDLAAGEEVPDGEAQAISTIVDLIQARVRAAAQSGIAHRDAHVKAHGCVSARFHVKEDLPAELRVGVFSKPLTYKVWIRFSNGNESEQRDGVGDGRGIAIKLMDVDGSPSTTQDFLLVNYPAFFVRNAKDYIDFQKDGTLRFFFGNFNPFRFRLHELSVARSITRQKVTNPLNTRYWSMTPYRFGQTVCKFSVRPSGKSSRYTEDTTPNFLHDNLVNHLASAGAAFDFMVQLRTKPVSMPIEDPTIIWDEKEAPFESVATITIGQQEFDTPEQRAFSEELSFSPWHCVDELRPVGGINRARRAVYEAVSKLRHDLNQIKRQEPTDFTIPPVVVPPAPMSAANPTDTNAKKELHMSNWFSRELFSAAGSAIDGWGWLSGEASSVVINEAVKTTRNRPHPFSTLADYTSWQSLTDRTYLARHLPPANLAVLPEPSKVQALFMRPNGAPPKLSNKSTCLFPAFAQYLTDGFIRTVPGNPAKTTTNHDIDLCPLYGRLQSQTTVLRLNENVAGRRGRLKSQIIQGEEYSPFYFLTGTSTPDPQFNALDPPLLTLPGQNLPPVAQLSSIFAAGGDRVNTSPFSAMINTLLLREHNRVASELERQNSGWDDERVFQTARNILIAMFIKVVVEQYINHIAPLPFAIRADPKVAWTANWNRPNWITTEFSLLYRWHSMMPDVINWPDANIPMANFQVDNRPLLRVPLAQAFIAASTQKAGAIGAFNTTPALIPIEMSAVRQARVNHLDTYNNYRLAFGMSKAESFSDISSDKAIQKLLEDLYKLPENVEFYPGLFAEDRVPDSPLPGLILRMVAVDAFSQALTNPLLSEHVFNAQTFTDWGFALISATSKLGDILSRNVTAPINGAVEMTQAGWTYVKGP